MNDEIKEILDYLTKFINDKEEITKYGCEISVKKAKVLLDYITNLQEQLHQASLDIQELTERDIECPSWCDKLTNLQQENQELNDSITWWTNRFNAVQRDYEDYKSRIEKAVEILKDTNVDMPSTLLIETIDNGINILNGRSDE